ncbi:MAG: aminodeoxychorismate synthase component I [Kiritimatiellae bacterium]|nr:aminodeoxychorismate synthase component I [Kiritimatiellia bacterium]
MHVLRKPERNEAVMYDPAQRCWMLLADPVRICCVNRLGDVLPALAELEERIRRERLYAAGFISYEASPAFDAALSVCAPDEGTPLLWFGLYRRVETGRLPRVCRFVAPPAWHPDLTRREYDARFERIRAGLSRGETYQVNSVFTWSAPFKRDAWEYFRFIAQGARAPYAAFLNTEQFAVCPFSPELFFRRVGERVWFRPMKGTAARAAGDAGDACRANGLLQCAKNRAESVMIGDMIRNDIGRVAEAGTVETPELFRVEKYPSVWQMTSTVTAAVCVDNTTLLRAVFPCASITGAPKRQTMRIIAETEQAPRGIYTGAIGWMGPAGAAQFNVAIRTVWIDHARGRAVYGTGGGIVWDSNAEAEYQECRDKVRVITEPRRSFSLLETIRWDPGEGFALLDEHLDRLERAGDYFQYTVSRERVLSALSRAEKRWGVAGVLRIRLLVNQDGVCRVEHFALGNEPDEPRVGLSCYPVDTESAFVLHKTTERRLYRQVLRDHPGWDDVLLWNSRKELTESCMCNVALRVGGELVTPALSSGLLPGVMRGRMLEKGLLCERVVGIDELVEAEEVLLINSVRGVRRIKPAGCP